MGIITYFMHSGHNIYPYDNTYLVSLFGVLSTRIASIFGFDTILIADWFSQGHLKLNGYGTGFSIIGEAYVNGGYFGGLLYMLLWGVVFGKLLVSYNFKDAGSNALRLFVTTASLNVLLKFSRGASYLVVKELFYGVAVLCLVIAFMRRSYTYETKLVRTSKK
jgi:hypothetical protein